MRQKLQERQESAKASPILEEPDGSTLESSISLNQEDLPLNPQAKPELQRDQQPHNDTKLPKKGRKGPKHGKQIKNTPQKSKKRVKKSVKSQQIPLFIVLSDQIIRLSHAKKPEQLSEMRKVSVLVLERDRNNTRIMEFLTNNRKLSPNTIALAYHERWKVEAFYKTIKQNLVIKSFLGTSENAVRCQIFSAMVAILLIKYVQLSAMNQVIWNFSNLLHILRLNFFCYFDIFTWLRNNDPDKSAPPGKESTFPPIQHNRLF
jgi:hypothetical protein